MHNYLKHKKVLHKKLKDESPQLKVELGQHPYVQQIHAFADAAKGKIDALKLFHAVQMLVPNRDEVYKSAFDKVSSNAEKYIESLRHSTTYQLENVFLSAKYENINSLDFR